MAQAKKMNYAGLAIIAIMVISVIISAYAYPYLPAKLAIHWGINGEANGFAPKEYALALMPALIIILGAVLYFIPKIDPLKENIQKFRGEYSALVAIICGFLLYTHIITTLLNFGINFNIGQALSPAFAVLFFFIGWLLPKAKRNYFIGIRTPWTLASDKVWDRTHKIGGKLFKAAGILCLGGIILPDLAVFFIIAPIIAAAVIAVVYSYKEFAAQKK